MSRKAVVHRSRGAATDSDALAFLRMATPPGVNGCVIAIDPNKEGGAPGQISGLAYTSESFADVGAFIASHNEQHHNIYWSINPTRTPLGKKPTKPDIAEMRWVHLDLDDPSDAALESVLAYRLPPTMIVRSGGGFNVYWRLEKPIHANGNIRELEDVLRGVIADFGADKGTQNLDRILRVPGTVNFPTKAKLKRGRVPVPAVLLEHHLERTYDLSDFPTMTELDFKHWKKPGADAPSPKSHDAESPKDGKPEGKVGNGSRSEDLLRKVADDVRLGLSDEEIHAKRDSHEHAADQSDPARAVQRCLDKVRSEASNVVDQINAENALIWVNGKLLVMWHKVFERGLPRLSHVVDAKIFWKTMQRGKTSPVDLWLSSTRRKIYQGFTFEPGTSDTGNLFNLFRGWGVTPDPEGDCSLFLAHLRDVICNGDLDLFDYDVQWLANAVQKPMDKPGTALAMRSRQGAGKGLLARYLGPIFGAHMAHVGSSDQLLGKFNAWLAGKIMVFGDEAAWPGNKQGLDKLKNQITENRIMVEEKNLPVFEIDNYARYLLATNRDHAAPAEADDRRYVMHDVNNAHINDEAYWTALEAERLGRGPAALLHYLLNVQLTRNLRVTPKTAALAEQKLLGLDDVGAFARQLLLKNKHWLDGGVDPDSGTPLKMVLEFGEVIGVDTLHQFYLDFAKRNSVRYPRSLDALGVNLRRYFNVVRREPRKDERDRLKLGNGRGVRVYALPTREEARASFEAALGQKVDWPVLSERAK